MTNYAGAAFVLALMFFPALLHGLSKLVCHLVYKNSRVVYSRHIS